MAQAKRPEVKANNCQQRDMYYQTEHRDEPGGVGEARGIAKLKIKGKIQKRDSSRMKPP
jgi:hypothetical protein